MTTVNEFCCGCTLRTGSLIVLWMWLIAGFYGIHWEGMSIAFREELMKSSSGWNGVHTFDARNIFELYVDLGISVAWIVTSLLGIVGIHKDKERYITPHLYVQGFYILHNFFTTTWKIFFPESNDTSTVMGYIKRGLLQHEQIAMWVFVGQILITAIFVYFWIIVRSYRNTLSEKAAGKKAIELPYACESAPPAYLLKSLEE